VDEGRVVQDGNVFTGGGVTAGIDLALTVIAELAGEELAKRIQLGLEYAPQPPFDAGRPEQAPAATLAALRQALSSTTASNRERIEQFVARVVAHSAAPA
jgi:transcriptional regulator GlxA family with amidase domain